MAGQVATIYTGVNGYLDILKVEQVKRFFLQLCEYITTNKLQFGEIVHSTKRFTEQAETQNQLSRGRRLCELLKQAQSAPLSVEGQVATVYTRIFRYLDILEVGQVKRFLIQLVSI